MQLLFTQRKRHLWHYFLVVLARRAQRGARARAPGTRQREETSEEPPAPSYHDEENMPRGPRVFDDSDDEPEPLEGDDEEIDSDEAFGEDDEYLMGVSLVFFGDTNVEHQPQVGARCVSGHRGGGRLRRRR